MEDFLRQFDRAFHLRAAAGQHDPGGANFLEPAAPHLGVHQAQ